MADSASIGHLVARAESQPDQLEMFKGAGNPIDILTGAKSELIDTGIKLAGVSLILKYDTTPKLGFVGADDISKVRDHPSFGELWRSTFHRRLQVANTGKTAVVSRGDGAMWSFTGNAGTFTAIDGNPFKLSTVSGGYLLTDTFTGALEYYNSSGYLTSMVLPNGKSLAFSYGLGQLTSVRASDGRAVQFLYSNNRITRILGSDLGTINVTYDANGNLSTWTWQDGKTAAFLYENTTFPWAMTGKVNEKNVRYATFEYDDQARAVSTERAGGTNKVIVTHGDPPRRVPSLTWNATKGVYEQTYEWVAGTGTQVTLPSGQVRTLTTQVAAGIPAATGQSQPAASGCQAATTAVSYNSAGLPSSKDNFTGARTCYAYDANNREITRVEGLGASDDCAAVLAGSIPATARKVTTTWHPDWHKQVSVTRPLNKTTTVYHGQPDPYNGNATASCTSASAMPNGKPLPLVCKQVEEALLANGATDSSVGLRVRTNSFDSAGRIQSSVDPLGQTTTYSYASSTSFPTSDDPHFDKVVLLLHGNGTDGSTTFTDHSWMGRAPTAIANAKVSTAQSKFGGASLYFDGTGDALEVPYLPQFTYGSNDFTIEGFFYKNANNPSWSQLWGPSDAKYDGFTAWINPSGGLEVYISKAGTSWVSYTPVTTLANGQWYHLAFVRSGGSLFTFVNGTKYTNATNLGTDSLFTNMAYPRNLGGMKTLTNYAFNGYIDDFRWTMGVARYTANFTVPAAELPNTGPNLGTTGMRSGELQSTTNAAGHVMTINSYDPAGRVRQATDSKGVVTETTYTPRGQVASVSVTPPGLATRTTTNTYDDAGLLVSTTYPDGTAVSYTYDAAHRLVGVTDAKGNTTTYTLDGQGRRIVEEIRDSASNLQRTITRSYDTLNRLQQVTGGTQ